jgi:hypothetical protein
MLSTAVSAQSNKSLVRIVVSQNSEVEIQVKVGSARNRWSFLNSYAGALGLGDRIKNFKAFNSEEEVATRKVASGEFSCDREANALRYTVDISPRRPGDFAHISWATRNSGLLMLADLLPEALVSENEVFVSVDLPPGMKIESSSIRDDQDRFIVSQPEKAVFLLGNRFDVQSKVVNAGEVKVVLSDGWKFRSKDVLKSAAKTLDWYYKLTGHELDKPSTILIGTFPPSDSTASWKAETRGSTVILLLNPQAQVKNWLGQVGIVLTHELFHFWVPNALAFNGDYDWFFEGFTLYVALQTALKFKLINFQEYMDTLARVYDSYLSYSDEQSLIEASERRWTSSVPVVYDKGMLVAFVLDLVIRSEGRGTTSLLDIYKVIFDNRGGAQSDANEVIIRLLATSPATEQVVSSYVKGRERVELEKTLPAFGFDLSLAGSQSRLSVRKDLKDPQKQLIRSLEHIK